MDFWERLRSAIDKQSERKRFFSDLSIALNSLSTWSKRETYPAGDILYKIAQILDVSMEYLVAGEEGTAYLQRIMGTASVRDDLRGLVRMLDQLPADDLKMVNIMVSGFYDRQQAAAKHG